MNPTELPPAFPAAASTDGRGKGYITALICALISVVLIRSGFLAFFFLVPLGYAAAVCTTTNALRALAAAIGFNIFIALGFGFFLHLSPLALTLDALYYTLLYLLFFWIMAPPERGPGLFRVRTAYRLLAGAVAGGLTFLFIEYIILNTAGISPLFRSQAEFLSSLLISSSGADAVRRSYVEQTLTPERLMELLRLGALRGGAAASSLFLFFISRQLAWSLAWILRRIRPLGPGSGSLRTFFVPPHTIWVFSFSLAAVLGSRISGLTLAETLSWNVLTLCTLLFLAQGGGIVLYTLSRRAMPPLLRLFLNILVIALIFSPGINALALGILILLGIAENWVPFRAPKTDGSPSTPGV
jgi:hypothetical protein